MSALDDLFILLALDTPIAQYNISDAKQEHIRLLAIEIASREWLKSFGESGTQAEIGCDCWQCKLVRVLEMKPIGEE